jgi:hypothetical protein
LAELVRLLLSQNYEVSLETFFKRHFHKEEIKLFLICSVLFVSASTALCLRGEIYSLFYMNFSYYQIPGQVGGQNPPPPKPSIQRHIAKIKLLLHVLVSATPISEHGSLHCPPQTRSNNRMGNTLSPHIDSPSKKAGILQYAT